MSLRRTNAAMAAPLAGTRTTTAISARSDMMNLVRDTIGLLAAIGRSFVAAVVGHDFGASVAAWCALLRPDMFRSRRVNERAVRRTAGTCAGALAAWTSIGRWRRWTAPAQALPVVLLDARGQWRHGALPAGHAGLPAGLLPSQKRRLAGQPGPFLWLAGRPRELARMPTYYIMDLDQDMPQTVAMEMPSA